MITPIKEFLGTFTNNSGTFAINDARGDIDGQLGNIKQGQWNAYVEQYDNRNLRLVIIHEDYKNKDYNDFDWVYEKSAFVDISTGYVGVFDISDFQGGEDFYDRYNIQEGDMCGKNFVKCMTGLGDGYYDIFWSHDKEDNVIGVMVEFLDEEWFEED
jgi:hypothetical protein